jgi:hypothetical protein
MLHALEQYWMDGGFADDRERLLVRAKALAAQT